MTAMSLKTAAQCLEFNLSKDIATYIWGKPGVGKSDVVKQVAKRLKIGLVDIRLSLRDPVDLRGLPLVDAKSGKTRWLAPAELPQVERDGEEGILFLDEANLASPAMQGAAMGLVLDRRLGEYILPEGWRIVAAGNRMIDRAAAQRMGTALRNRFSHFEVDVDLDAWVEWANSVELASIVVALIRFRQELLHRMPTGDENSFPTPRAWEKVAKLVDAPEAIRQYLVEGLVGPGPAAEFEGYIRLWTRVPSLETILSQPATAPVPAASEPGLFYAISSKLARVANKKNFAAILTYVARLPKEFEILTVVDAARREPLITKTHDFVRWAVANQQVTI